LLKTDFTKNIQTIGRRMTLITDTERKNSRKKNVRSISALINKPKKKKRKKQQEPDALNCRFWYHPVTTNSLNILSIFSLTLQNYKLFRFCFPGCVFTRSNLHISKSWKFQQEFSEKRIFFLPEKKRNFLRSLRNSYNHSETKMSKLRTKQKLVVCWVQGRIIHQHRRKKMVEGNCCIAAAYLKKTFFFLCQVLVFFGPFRIRKFSSKQHPSITVHLRHFKS